MMPDAVAELHATTSIFAPSPISRRATASERSRTEVTLELTHRWGLVAYQPEGVCLGEAAAVSVSMLPIFAMLAFVLFFIVQVLLSRWWLARFSQGPLEWLWRGFTYLRFERPGRTAAT